MKRFARPVAVLAASAAMLSPLALVSSSTASAHAGRSTHSTEQCTISAADRAAVLDKLSLVNQQLAGTHHPSQAEKASIHRDGPESLYQKICR